MPALIKSTSALSLAATVFFAIMFHCFHKEIYLTILITCGTIAYHFIMRLLIGLTFNIKMNNKADYMHGWYKLHFGEKKLYKLIKVKKWKNKMPTYSPEKFSPTKFTWDEIAQAMCQAELVHETIIVLSFIPVLASIWLDSLYVFLITSICAALFDLMFVIIQRYNRDRIMILISRTNSRRKHTQWK